jgi:hypothetical protein
MLKTWRLSDDLPIQTLNTQIETLHFLQWLERCKIGQVDVEELGVNSNQCYFIVPDHIRDFLNKYIV